MKVLLVHNSYRSGNPGGEDVVFAQERDLLERNGLDVVVYQKANDDVRNIAQAIKAGAQVHWSRTVFDEISTILSKERPEVAHFHNTFPLITPSAYAACKAQGVPVVQTLHNYRLLCVAATFFRDGVVCEKCRPGQPLSGILHRCYSKSLVTSAATGWMLWRNWRLGVYRELVDVYVALTQFAATKFVEAGLSSDQVVVKPNFVVRPIDSEVPGLQKGAYAVFAGRISKEKGVYTLLKAWRELTDVPLRIVGDGPALADLRDIAQAESLPVEFLGMQSRSEVLRLIGNASVQIVPSEWYEGFPMVIVEAYACGTPVIASNLGGLMEVVTPETGRLFPPGDERSLARCVRELWVDRGLRDRLGQAARALYENLYTPERNMEMLRSIYELAIARAAHPKPLHSSSN